MEVDILRPRHRKMLHTGTRYVTRPQLQPDEHRQAHCEQPPRNDPAQSGPTAGVCNCRHRPGEHSRLGCWVLESDPRLTDIPQPLPRVLRKTTPQHPLDLKGQAGRQLAPVGFGLKDTCQGITCCFAEEKLFAGQHFEKNHPEGPDVRPPVDFFSAGLLGAHVGRGAQYRAHLGHGRGQGRVARYSFFACCLIGKDTRQPEVQHLHLAIWRALDVGGFEVTVDDSLFVGLFEPFGNLARDVHRFVDGQWPLAQCLSQVVSFDQFHNQKRAFVRGLKAEDGSDVGMVQGSQKLGLTVKPGHAVPVFGKFTGQDFQSDVAVQFSVLGAVDLAHAAFSDQFGDTVVGKHGSGFHKVP